MEGETQTTERTRVTFDDVGFFLAPGQDVAQLKREIEEALQSGGRFVDVLVAGGRAVSILVSAARRIVISVEAVESDLRDPDDDDARYGGVFDLI